jgi:carbamoyl-phosphate synthase large subunit
MVHLATKIVLGKKLKDMGYQGGLWKRQKIVAIKAPVFSMSKLIGVDWYLGPEMKSTGEVMGLDYKFGPALAKALAASNMTLAAKSSILMSVADRDKPEAMGVVKDLLQSGCKLYATEGTAAMIEAMGGTVTMITKKLQEGHPNVVDVINDGTVQAVINTVSDVASTLRDGFYIRRAAAERRIPCYTSLDTARVAAESLLSEDAGYSVEPMDKYLDGGENGSR